jgi:hypothetical protein
MMGHNGGPDWSEDEYEEMAPKNMHGLATYIV